LLAGRDHGALEGDAIEFSGFAEARDQQAWRAQPRWRMHNRGFAECGWHIAGFN
jgi:hypothetical protein